MYIINTTTKIFVFFHKSILDCNLCLRIEIVAIKEKKLKNFFNIHLDFVNYNYNNYLKKMLIINIIIIYCC